MYYNKSQLALVSPIVFLLTSFIIHLLLPLCKLIFNINQFDNSVFIAVLMPLLIIIIPIKEVFFRITRRDKQLIRQALTSLCLFVFVAVYYYFLMVSVMLQELFKGGF